MNLYRSGKSNGVPDTLSRKAYLEEENSLYTLITINSPVMSAIDTINSDD